MSAADGQPKQPFIPAWLDGLGLAPNRYRVLSHLWMRANWKTRRCFPGVPSIAKICRINEDTVWIILGELEAGGHFKKYSRPGESNVYELQINPTPPTRNEGVPMSDNPPENDGRRAPETKGAQAPETEGLHPPETKGCKGTRPNVPHQTKLSEGATGHTPLVLELSDADLQRIATAEHLSLECVRDGLATFNLLKTNWPKDERSFAALNSWLLTTKEGKRVIKRHEKRTEGGKAQSHECPIWRNILADELAGSAYSLGGRWEAKKWDDLPKDAKEQVWGFYDKRAERLNGLLPEYDRF